MIVCSKQATKRKNKKVRNKAFWTYGGLFWEKWTKLWMNIFKGVRISLKIMFSWFKTHSQSVKDKLWMIMKLKSTLLGKFWDYVSKLVMITSTWEHFLGFLQLSTDVIFLSNFTNLPPKQWCYLPFQIFRTHQTFKD